jgi:hypothetical protein
MAAEIGDQLKMWLSKWRNGGMLMAAKQCGSAENNGNAERKSSASKIMKISAAKSRLWRRKYGNAMKYRNGEESKISGS